MHPTLLTTGLGCASASHCGQTRQALGVHPVRVFEGALSRVSHVLRTLVLASTSTTTEEPRQSGLVALGYGSIFDNITPRQK
jgi:hypothetical protein